MPQVQDETLERRLDEVVTEYLVAVEAGASLDRQEWLTRYPDLAEGLAAFFADTDWVCGQTEPLCHAVRGVRTQQAAGIRLGEYELLNEIGRGGNGVVYKARQISLNRVVALKMVRMDQLGDETERRRLKNEAETVAQLDHSHVVPVYEVGEQDGQLYFSMKLFGGGSLADKLDHFKTQPRLAVQAIAKVARAVHHAHQRGVLHRDLKPSNILMDANSQPSVADFGLAKRFNVEPGASVTGDPTRSTAILGTPSYMAPEQTVSERRALTTAVDVYGLGSTLYALLTGGPPFKDADVVTTITQVREQAPDSPGNRNPLVDKDLATICLKCLEKEPQSRYPSAEAVAQDLERWLSGEPIQARPLGFAKRLWRYCRRKPFVAVPITTAVVLSMVILIGLPIGTYMIWKEQQRTEHSLFLLGEEQQRTEQARQKESEHRQRAEASYRLAHGWLEEGLDKVLGDPRLKGGPLEDLRRTLLEDRKAFYEKFVALEGDAPAFQLERVQALTHLGFVAQELGSPNEALTHFRQALAICTELTGDYPDQTEYQEWLRLTNSNLGDMYRQIGQAQEGEQFLLEAAALCKDLVRKNPDLAKNLYNLGRVQNNLGLLYCDTRRLEDALRSLNEAQAVLTDACGKYPKDLDCLSELARTEANFGLLFGQYHGKPKSAARPFEESLANYRLLAREDPKNPERRKALAGACLNLGACYWQAGQMEKAEQPFKEAVDSLSALTQERPLVVEYKMMLAKVQQNLGYFFMSSNRPQDAERAFREALKLAQKLADESPAAPVNQSGLGSAFHDLGTVLVTRDPAEASRLFEKAIDHQKTALNANPNSPVYRRNLSSHYSQMCEALLKMRDHKAANKAALAMTDFGSTDSQTYTLAASIVAQCVPLAENDTRLIPEKRQEAANAYKQGAMNVLKTAVRLGFKDVDVLKDEPAFASLHGVEEYKLLLKELENAKKP